VRLIDAAGRTVLRYAGLLAWDAAGTKLPARLAADAGRLMIEVDDAGAVYPVTIDPTVVQEDAKLTASDAVWGDRFGQSVALSGDTTVVGVRLDATSTGRTDAGSAYVFNLNQPSIALLNNLVGTVVGLNIQHGITNSLNAKLNAAIRALDDVNENNNVAAIETLEAFITAVEAQRGNHITETDVDLLIAAAQEIIDLLLA